MVNLIAWAKQTWNNLDKYTKFIVGVFGFICGFAILDALVYVITLPLGILGSLIVGVNIQTGCMDYNATEPCGGCAIGDPGAGELWGICALVGMLVDLILIVIVSIFIVIGRVIWAAQKAHKEVDQTKVTEA